MSEASRLAATAPIYENWTGIDRELTEEVGRAILDHVKEGGTGLELGWGSGVMHSILRQRLARLHVIEGDAALVQRAQESEGLFGDFVYWCMFEGFSSSARYDDIIMSEVLEHVEDPHALLTQAKTWLAPGGRIHVVVPNGNSIHRLLATVAGLMFSPTALGATDKRNGHRRTYTWEAISREVRHAGLEIIHMEGILVKPFPGPGMNLLTEIERRRLFELAPACPKLCAEVYVVCRRPESS